MFYQSSESSMCLRSLMTGKAGQSIISSVLKHCYFFKFRRPPALPYRHQYSTIGRLRLNCRVRDGNECFPQTYRHRKLTTLSLRCFGTADERVLVSVRPADRNFSRRSLHEGSEGSRTQAKGSVEPFLSKTRQYGQPLLFSLERR